jgi:hypothetical protein
MEKNYKCEIELNWKLAWKESRQGFFDSSWEIVHFQNTHTLAGCECGCECVVAVAVSDAWKTILLNFERFLPVE